MNAELDPETAAYIARLVDAAPPITPEAAALFARTFTTETAATPVADAA